MYGSLHKQGIGVLQTKGLTEEEECSDMWKTFQDIYEMGYEHIHTLLVEPLDGRKPYFVQIDGENRK